MDRWLAIRNNEEKWCAAVAITSLITAVAVTIFVSFLICIGTKDYEKPDGLLRMSQLQLYIHQHFGNVNEPFTQAILGMILFISLAGIAASIVLVFGIKIQKSGYLMCYFCFVIVTGILVLITGLLLLVNGYWNSAICMLVIFPFCICGMVIVYRTYDSMEQDRQFNNYAEDMRVLIEDD